MWSCPKCETRVDDGFDVCWQCGTNREGVEDPTFMSADQAPPIVDPIYDPIASPGSDALGTPHAAGNPLGGELVEAYQAFSLMESKFIADQLVAQGIPAMSDTQDMQDALGVLDGNPRVYVRSNDFARARAWLEAYEANRAAHPERHLNEE
jgi:hypothetical protein